MTEITGLPAQGTPGAAVCPDDAATLGQRLAAARGAQGLAVEDVARVVRFSPRQIAALERDDFSGLPEAAIVRGFVRSYARLLRIEPAPLLQLLDRQLSSVCVATTMDQLDVSALPPLIERGWPWRRVLLAVILGGVIVAAGVRMRYSPGEGGAAMNGDDAAALQAAASAQAAQAAARSLSAPEDTAAALLVRAEKTAATPGTVPASSKPPLPVAASAPVSVVADASTERRPEDNTEAAALRPLTFAFDGTAWVEVKDADRRVVYAQNNLAGTQQVVRGKPPLSIVISNASNVRLQYGETAVDLAPHTQVDVARLTLE